MAMSKSGTNDYHLYKYATAADVLENVNASLVKRNVAVASQTELIDIREVLTQKGNTERLATVKTTLSLVDAESGETLSCSGIGRGHYSYLAVPFKKMAGFRDVVTHNYDGISYDMIWEVAQKDIPQLVSEIERMLDEQ